MKSAWWTASGWLVLLALVLPFERRAEVLRVFGLALTNVEIVLYLFLTAWVATRLARRAWRVATVDAAALALAGAALLSAAAAPAYRGEAMRFALRGLSGALLFVAARDVLGAADARRWVSRAVVAGALLAAAAALAEAVSPGVAASLLAFKASTFRAGEALRASGTLEYPTTGAMYWEAALPFALALGVRGRVRTAASAAAALLLLAAIVLSGSRAGVAVALGVLCSATVVDGRWRRAATLSLAGLAVAMAAAAAVHGPRAIADRVVPHARLPWYRAVTSLADGATVREGAGGETMVVTLTVENRGALGWPAAGAHAVSIVPFWTRTPPNEAVSGAGAPLPADVPPGGETTVAVALVLPAEPGAYRVAWRLGQNGALWDGTDEGALEVRVRASGASATAAPAVRLPVQRQSSRLDLWRAGLRLFRDHPLLGVGPDNFRRLYGPHLGPRAMDDRIHANSLYVETAADLGLFGLLALAALIATLAAAARRVDDVEGRAGALAVAAFLVHGLVDQFLAFTPTLGLFWLAAAFVAAPPAQREGA